MTFGAQPSRTWESHVQLDESELAAAWHQYRRTDDEQLRNLLVEHYLPQVKYDCERIHASLPEEVDTDDCISAGLDGLRTAVKSFDPERGVQFKTYCSQRIRGAVLDMLRRCDWLTRLARARANRLARARTYLRCELGRHPADEEVAEHMGVTRTKFARIVRDARAAEMISLNQDISEEGADHTFREADRLRDPRAESPECRAQRGDIRQLISRGCSDMERSILLLYYYEELTMKEIGAVLGTSESRISQIHAELLDRLRDVFANRRDEFVLAR